VIKLRRFASFLASSGRHTDEKYGPVDRILFSLFGAAILSVIVVFSIGGSPSAALPSASVVRHQPQLQLSSKVPIVSPRSRTQVYKASPVTYKVQANDSLSKIAGRLWNDSHAWPALWWANRHRVKDPGTILVGWKLRVPTSHQVPHWMLKRALVAAAPIVTVTVASSPVSSASPITAPAPSGTVPPSSFTSCVISRESGGDPTAYNSSSGASGLFGMLLSTWLSTGVGYSGGAYTAPSSVQYSAFYILYARDGVSPWRPYDGC